MWIKFGCGPIFRCRFKLRWGFRSGCGFKYSRVCQNPKFGCGYRFYPRIYWKPGSDANAKNRK